MLYSNVRCASMLVAGLSAFAAPSAQAAFRVPGETDASEYVVITEQISATFDAQSAFWNLAGKCINAEFDDFADLMDCVNEAQAELGSRLRLIQEQSEARSDLIELLDEEAYDPQFDPDDFTANVTNPYFALVPGRTLVYEAHTKEGVERIEVSTLNQTQVIGGVNCRVVRDVVKLNGELIEDTIDWFAQDDDGNVWYFGESVKNFQDGFLESIDGSWRANHDGALPGYIMLAAPTVGEAYREEFQLGEAEDYSQVLALNETVTLPQIGVLQHCRKTMAATPLEPGQIEQKFFAPGIGFVKQITPSTGKVVELVQIIGP